MGNKKRDVSGLMSRRLQAAALFAKGLTQAEVARRLGVSRTSTMHWYDAWKSKGKQGLQLAEHFGRPTKTTAADLARIEAALLKGPAAHGWTTEIWTLPRIAKLIEETVGVHYHPGHVWRILRDLGWSLQRPTTKARERNEAAIARFKAREWARVKKTPDPAARSSSSMKPAFPKGR